MLYITNPSVVKKPCPGTFNQRTPLHMETIKQFPEATIDFLGLQMPENVEFYSEIDGETFGWLYKHYSDKLYEYLYLLSNDATLSEDIVQDVFMKIWTNRKSLKNVKNVNAYICASAKNRLLDLQKRKRTERLHLDKWRYLFVQHNEENPLTEKETNTLIKKALSSLSKRERLFYYLTRETEKSHMEISNEYKISINTVKNILVNANRKLKKYIVVKQ